MTARDALEAYMVHESDEAAAEFGKRLDAYVAEWQARAEKAEAELERLREGLMAAARETGEVVTRLDRAASRVRDRRDAATRRAQGGAW